MHGLSILRSLSTLELGAKISSFVVLTWLLVLSPLVQGEEEESPLSTMSVEQKVGQTMIWGFNHTELDADFESLLHRYQPGALIVFKRNIRTAAQIGKLNFDLQKFAGRKLKAPLFLMVDQEGGVVTRVRISTPLPSALAVGRTENPELAQTFAKTKADLLKALNFNVNLAPVLDLSNPKKATFIGNRTFGDDPDLVSKMGMAYSRGMNASGLLPTAKHFPGHGNLTQDTHKTSAQKVSSEEDLENRDLVPFKEFITADFPRAVMMAHVSVPHLDASGISATYSKAIIEDYLRKKLNYNGLVFTDDLEMGGASDVKDIGERAVRAFLAGNDMMIFAGSLYRQRRAFQAMVKAVKSGRISEERLNESVRRILAAKKAMQIKPTPMDRQKALAAIKKLESLSKEIMSQNFKYAIEESSKTWPAVPPHGQRVAVFSSSGGFYRKFKGGFLGRTRIYPLTPSSLAGVPQELGKEKVAYGIFYASGKQTARYISRLSPEMKAKLIVVNCNEPGSVESQDSFMAVLNLNSHSPESGQWLAEALSLGNSPELRAPSGEASD